MKQALFVCLYICLLIFKFFAYTTLQFFLESEILPFSDIKKIYIGQNSVKFIPPPHYIFINCLLAKSNIPEALSLEHK